jgi:histidinol-phosphate phosphatase family protein
LKFPYVIFDRDGTLIEHVHHLRDSQFAKLKPDIGNSLLRLSKNGFRLGIITNQSVIGRQLASLSQVEEINRVISEHLEMFGIELQFILICPHHPEDHCECRKPKTALGIKASIEFGVDLEKSYYIGDQPTDVEFARNLGCKSVLIIDGNSHLTDSDYLAQSLSRAAEWIIIDAAKGGS